MNKYVIELRPDCKVVQEICESDGQVSIGAKSINYLEELNSDYINEHFGDLQDTAYRKGRESVFHELEISGSQKSESADDAYQRGLSEGNDIGYKDGVKDGQNEVWEAVKKIVFNPNDGGLSIQELNEIFGNASIQYVCKNYSASEAIEKLKAYEEKQKQDDKIEVGDEVVWTEDEDVVIVVSRIYTTNNNLNWYDGICKDGKVYHILAEHARKTGRHFDIASILEDMRND